MTTECALWLRVSTSEQDPANQRPELEALAGQRGWTIAEVYQVTDSAWKDNGPESEYERTRQQMLADAQAGKFSVLLIWSLDRLTRRGIEDAFSLLRELDDAGVIVVSSQEPWLGSADPMIRELMMAMMATLAKYESIRRSERTKAGIARRKAEGGHVGRKPGAKDKRPRRTESYVRQWAPGGVRRMREIEEKGLRI